MVTTHLLRTLCFVLVVLSAQSCDVGSSEEPPKLHVDAVQLHIQDVNFRARVSDTLKSLWRDSQLVQYFSESGSSIVIDDGLSQGVDSLLNAVHICAERPIADGAAVWLPKPRYLLLEKRSLARASQRNALMHALLFGLVAASLNTEWEIIERLAKAGQLSEKGYVLRHMKHSFSIHEIVSRKIEKGIRSLEWAQELSQEHPLHKPFDEFFENAEEMRARHIADWEQLYS